MKRLFYAICLTTVALATTVMLPGCSDDDTNIGSSLVEDEISVVMDSSFTLEGHSVLNSRVQSRTTTQLIGRINARQYGTLSSEIVTQFMAGVSLPTDSFTSADIDSVKLIMQMTRGAFTGDSVTPMGVKVYPLTAALPSPIYSDFDPISYYDAADMWGSAIYSATALGSDSLMKLDTRNIEVRLPREFAVKIYNEYRDNPATFSTPQSFTKWFPGLYIANSFGNGRISRIDKSFITMYYHRNAKSPSTGNDTVLKYTNTFMAVAPEIVTNNNIDYTVAGDLAERASTQSLLVAPTGYDVDITFPGREICAYYRANSGPIALLNALTMEIPVEEIANDYDIEPPTYILLVKTKKLDEFFAKNMITDGIDSFYAVYNSATRKYVFSDMSDYALDLLSKGTISDEDVEFTITPVNITYETSNGSSIITGIVPYVTTPVMARLMLDKAKIKLTFSKQTVTGL